jgi:hypothetical protein
MRVIHSNQGDTPSIRQQPIRQKGAAAAIGAHLAGVVVDFHGVRCRVAMPVSRCQPVPAGMGNGDKGAGFGATRSQRRAIFPGWVGAKSSGRPTARICQISPSEVAGA